MIISRVFVKIDEEISLEQLERILPKHMIATESENGEYLIRISYFPLDDVKELLQNNNLTGKWRM